MSSKIELMEAVIKAARTPECNFSEERECGSINGKYHHHELWCPQGRLIKALKNYDEFVKENP
jgi:hypothetical protein